MSNKWVCLMEKFKYNAFKYYSADSGIILKKEWFEFGIINCEYIPGIINYKSVYTQIDLKGPIFMYENCEIITDFGPIKKDEIYEYILLDYNVDCIHMDFGKNKNESIYLEFSEIE